MVEEGVALHNGLNINGDGTSVMKVTVLEEKIPEAAWKALHPFPNLNLEGKTQIWELDEAYRRWKDGCRMSADTINCEFATFVEEMFNWAEQTFIAYAKKCITEFPSKPSTWNAHTSNAEATMMTYLYGTLSEDMQLLVYSNKTNSGIFCLPSGRPAPQVIICIATI